MFLTPTAASAAFKLQRFINLKAILTENNRFSGVKLQILIHNLLQNFYVIYARPQTRKT